MRQMLNRLLEGLALAGRLFATAMKNGHWATACSVLIFLPTVLRTAASARTKADTARPKDPFLYTLR